MNDGPVKRIKTKSSDRKTVRKTCDVVYHGGFGCLNVAPLHNAFRLVKEKETFTKMLWAANRLIRRRRIRSASNSGLGRSGRVRSSENNELVT